IPLRRTGPQRLTPHRVGVLWMKENRLPALGDLGGELYILGSQRSNRNRNTFAHRVVDELQRLTQSRSAVLGQRDLVVLAVVVHALASPHLPADLHHLAGATDRRVKLDAVKALYDLRAGRADAQPKPPVGHVIQPRGG